MNCGIVSYELRKIPIYLSEVKIEKENIAMKRWKLFMVTAIAVLAMATFVGCGQRDDNGNQTNQATDGTTNENTDNKDDATDKNNTDNKDNNGDSGNVIDDATDGAADAAKDVVDGAENVVDDVTGGDTDNGSTTRDGSNMGNNNSTNR